MKKSGAIVGLVALVFICTSGLFEPITKVFVWFITLNFNAPTVSIMGQLVAKHGTWIVTYSLVGKLFKELGWFNSDAMKIIYFIISTIISFLLLWLIMILENYLWIIAIVIGSLLVCFIILIITLHFINKKKGTEEKAELQ